MTKTNQKGFTLIELLVVIAIIGILAGILFVAIDPKAQTDKANNAKAKSQLAQARTQAALVFSTYGNYSNVASNTQIGNLTDHVKSNAGSWAADAALDSGNWCVDSAGFTGAATADTTAGTNGAFDCTSGN